MPKTQPIASTIITTQKMHSTELVRKVLIWSCHNFVVIV